MSNAYSRPTWWVKSSLDLRPRLRMLEIQQQLRRMHLLHCYRNWNIPNATTPYIIHIRSNLHFIVRRLDILLSVCLPNLLNEHIRQNSNVFFLCFQAFPFLVSFPFYILVAPLGGVNLNHRKFCFPELCEINQYNVYPKKLRFFPHPLVLKLCFQNRKIF